MPTSTEINDCIIKLNQLAFGDLPTANGLLKVNADQMVGQAGALFDVANFDQATFAGVSLPQTNITAAQLDGLKANAKMLRAQLVQMDVYLLQIEAAFAL